MLVDPTLLLTKKEWLRITKVHTNKPKSKYLIVYFWGELPHERKDLIKKIAKKYNLEIVSIADLKDKQTYTADPSEFIDYINSASLVLTDSYHGTIFSILMGIPFFVFERIGGKSMYSRIETLLEMTNIIYQEEIKYSLCYFIFSFFLLQSLRTAVIKGGKVMVVYCRKFIGDV